MGRSLRLQSPFGAVFTAALVNGYSGYVPTLSGFFDRVGGPEVNAKCPWTSTINNLQMQFRRNQGLKLFENLCTECGRQGQDGMGWDGIIQ